VDLLINDLSLHGQFPDVPSFREAVVRVMAMRRTAGRFGREVHCHRNVANSRATHGLTVIEAVQRFSLEEKRVLLSWLTRSGPFWEDVRVHSPDDYLESGGAIVTDTAVGEAAFSRLYGTDRRVVSFSPSNWMLSPIAVSWIRDDGTEVAIEVVNFFEAAELEAALNIAPSLVSSWEGIGAVALARFSRLRFAQDAFDFLRGHPFVQGAAHRIMEILSTLDRIRGCMEDNGQLTIEGQRLYQSHFVGNKAWFSDSSDSEKNDFKDELTFRHPDIGGQKLFCTWHGKVKSPQIRIHFSWPASPDQCLYVVYVGPKITKR
jgi:hypothetical protein